MSTNPILWRPNKAAAESSAMYRMMRDAGCEDYAGFHAWSVAHSRDFWERMCVVADIEFTKTPEATLEQSGDMLSARWFTGGELNFAAHVLRHGSDGDAIVFRGEDGTRRVLSRDQLRDAAATFAAGLRDAGVQRGDRVAGFLPNCPEAVIAMLGATSIGAIWSSCSPDFGINGVVDRFGQIEPKVLVCANGYRYNGKVCDSLDAVRGVLEKIPAIEQTVVVPFLPDPMELDDIRGAVAWDEFGRAGEELQFALLPFDHPLYIMYSSGTTGVPKCIVHGAGGTLVQHAKEHLLHCDIRDGDRLFYFTTCGWMMWNWLVSGLIFGATIVLYDGSPFYDDGRVLWRMAEEERLTQFGTSAKFIAATEKAGLRPADEFDLATIRTIFSTGSVLAPESFDFVYDAISSTAQLASISGGTDIISCFAGGNPTLPVRRGELQCLALAMDVKIFDAEGRPVIGENGELVCTNAFPSMPVGFWNDADGRKYHDAYFDQYPGVWAHGDYAEITADGGMVIYGRSDAVLNPGGVRIGTAEIYRQVEKLDEVVESIAVGQNHEDDVRVVLFVVLREGVSLDDELQAKIRKTIRDNTTPRHVPAVIAAVPEIPRTISGKIVELAVRNVVHGLPVKNVDALLNPDALAHFADRPELQG